jgi:hypothetical protein
LIKSISAPGPSFFAAGDRPGFLAAIPNVSSWLSSFAEPPAAISSRPVSEVTITLFRYMVFSLKNPEPPLIDKTFIFMQLKQINHQNEDLRSF